MVVFSIFYVIQLHWSARDRLVTELKHRNELIVEGTRASLLGLESLLKTIGKDLVSVGALEVPQSGRWLIESTAAGALPMAGYGLAKVDGQLVLVSGVPSTVSLPNLLDSELTRESFERALFSDHLELGPPYYMDKLAQWVIPIRVAIDDAVGSLIAVMTAGLKISGEGIIWNRLNNDTAQKSIILHESGYIQYFDANTTRSFDMNKTYRMDVSDLIAFFHASELKEQFVGNFDLPETINFDILDMDCDSFVAYSHMADYGLYILTHEPYDAFLSKFINEVSPQIVGVFLFISTIIWGYFYSSSRHKQYVKNIVLKDQEIELQNTRMSLAAESGGIGVWDWDLQSDSLVWDDWMFHLYEMAPDEFDGTLQSWQRAVHTDDLPAVSAAYNACLDGQGDLDIEFRTATKSGEIKHIKATAVVLRDDLGRPYRMVGVNIDISDLKRTEAALVERGAALERSNQELMQFSYATSHDLREPLRSISSFIGLLELRLDGRLDDTTREYLDFVRDGAVRMDRLIQDILNFSQTGTALTSPTRVDMTRLVTKVIASFETLVPDEQTILTGHGDLPDCIATESEVERVLINLVSNALKYRSPQRRLTVQIKGWTENGYAVYAVADNGIGIAERFHERIFRMFQRLHSPEHYGGGTGIGLAMCKKVVEHHGGRIWVQSEPGKGSTFLFSLPKAG